MDTAWVCRVFTYIVCGAEVGNFVAADEVVARIETDKVTVDILSKHSGVITKFFAAEGDTVLVGAQFLEIDTDAKGSPAASAPPKAAESAQVPSKPAVSLSWPLRPYLSELNNDYFFHPRLQPQHHRLLRRRLRHLHHPKLRHNQHLRLPRQPPSRCREAHLLLKLRRKPRQRSQALGWRHV